MYGYLKFQGQDKYRHNRDKLKRIREQCLLLGRSLIEFIVAGPIVPLMMVHKSRRRNEIGRR